MGVIANGIYLTVTRTASVLTISTDILHTLLHEYSTFNNECISYQADQSKVLLRMFIPCGRG